MTIVYVRHCTTCIRLANLLYNLLSSANPLSAIVAEGPPLDYTCFERLLHVFIVLFIIIKCAPMLYTSRHCFLQPSILLSILITLHHHHHHYHHYHHHHHHHHHHHPLYPVCYKATTLVCVNISYNPLSASLIWLNAHPFTKGVVNLFFNLLFAC